MSTLNKWFEHWIENYYADPEAFDMDLRKSVVMDELKQELRTLVEEVISQDIINFMISQGFDTESTYTSGDIQEALENYQIEQRAKLKDLLGEVE